MELEAGVVYVKSKNGRDTFSAFKEVILTCFLDLVHVVDRYIFNSVNDHACCGIDITIENCLRSDPWQRRLPVLTCSAYVIHACWGTPTTVI